MNLDKAGFVLPEGLQFLRLGWWVIHVLAVAFVFAWGYQKGRRAGRREQQRGSGERRTGTAGADRPEP